VRAFGVQQQGALGFVAGANIRRRASRRRQARQLRRDWRSNWVSVWSDIFGQPRNGVEQATPSAS